jgi:hypothetical protein
MQQTAATWRPIGAVLVESGAITQAQLDDALADQRVSGKRLGEILIDSGAITWLALAHAIAEQAQDVDQRDEPADEVEQAEHAEYAEQIEHSEPVATVDTVESVEHDPVEQWEPVAAAVETPVEPEPAAPALEPVLHSEPPVSAAPTAEVTPIENTPPDSRLQTVEAMLKERQRAFLELVSTTETLRRTVARLKDELAARDTEIAKLRAAAAAQRL